MGSAAVADLSRSAVREAGMAPQAVHVCLAMGCQLSRSNGVSSHPKDISGWNVCRCLLMAKP